MGGSLITCFSKLWFGAPKSFAVPFLGGVSCSVALFFGCPWARTFCCGRTQFNLHLCSPTSHTLVFCCGCTHKLARFELRPCKSRGILECLLVCSFVSVCLLVFLARLGSLFVSFLFSPSLSHFHPQTATVHEPGHTCLLLCFMRSSGFQPLVLQHDTNSSLIFFPRHLRTFPNFFLYAWSI